MENLRGCLGTLAMIFFLATVLIGWGMMVLLPVLAGGPPIANVGIVVLCSVGSLVLWRVAGGPGWGFRPDPERSSPGSTLTVPGSPATSPSRLLPEDWAEAFERRAFDGARLDQLLRRAYPPGAYVYPPKRYVFRAFWETPLRQVKVVILGLDPYSKAGEADGLAFSHPGAALPHSLKRVFANLEADPGVVFQRPHTGDLKGWAQEGVLLLNTALTVRESDPKSDLTIWREFTHAALDIVNAEAEPVAFLLWGDEASDAANRVGIAGRHLVSRSTHPVQESPTRYPRFAETRHFSAANEFLSSRGRSPIDWSP